MSLIVSASKPYSMTNEVTMLVFCIELSTTNNSKESNPRASFIQARNVSSK